MCPQSLRATTNWWRTREAQSGPACRPAYTPASPSPSRALRPEVNISIVIFGGLNFKNIKVIDFCTDFLDLFLFLSFLQIFYLLLLPPLHPLSFLPLIVTLIDSYSSSSSLDIFPTHLISHEFLFLLFFSSLTHFYFQQILVFLSFYLSPSSLLLFSLRPLNAFPLPLHLIQSFSHIFYSPQINFFVILYSIILY